MEKLLIITEKPDAKRNFVKALGGESGTFDGDEYVIVNLVGHIMEYGKPSEVAYANQRETIGGFNTITETPWRYDQFDWNKKQLRSDLGDIYKNIGRYLKAGYIPVIASDIDPMGEGDLLVHEVLISLGYDGKMYREYHIDESKAKITKALREKKVVTHDDPAFQMAFARSICDFSSQQLTRVASKDVHEKGYDIPYVPFGRFKSYTLRKLAEQIQAIKDYKPSSEYESRYKLDNLILTSKDIKRFKTKDEWDPQGLPQEAKVREVKQLAGVTPPPKLYIFNDLAGDISKRGIRTRRTEALYQKMYEAGYLTYIRTEDDTITNEQFNEFYAQLDDLLALLNLPAAAFTHREKRATYVSDKGSHGGMRSGEKIPESLEALDAEFGKGASLIYKTVISRALMMFLEDTEWVKHYYETVGTDPVFKAEIKIITKQGVVDPDEDTSDIQKTLPDISKMATLYPHEVKSVKPAAPTASWILREMKKDNIGTPATQVPGLNNLIGDDAKSPIIDGKILSLSPMGQLGYLYGVNTRISTAEGTKFLHDVIKSVSKGKETVQGAFDKFRDLLESDMDAIKNTHVDLTTLGLPKSNKKVVEGVWQGRNIKFNGIYAGHEFTDDEIDKLLNDEEIAFDGESKGKSIKLQGKLEEQEYKGHKFIGFKGSIVREGYVDCIWQGKEAKYKGSFMDYVFTDEDNAKLQAGETISFKTHKDDKEYSVSGKLAVQEYKGRKYLGFKAEFENKPREGYITGTWQGKQVQYKGSFMDYVFTDEDNVKLQAGEIIKFKTHKDDKEYSVFGKLEIQDYQGRKYVGFKPQFESTPREGYVTGTWQGKQVQYKGSFMDYVFTDEDNAKLQAGETIKFKTHKDDKEYSVFGKLEIQDYQGRKYVGFKPQFESKPRDGYVTGTWQGKQVQYKGSFMGHTFTDDENQRLLNGEKIVITGTNKAGKQRVIGGGLAEQNFKGRKYVGFKAEFDDKQGKNDGML